MPKGTGAATAVVVVLFCALTNQYVVQAADTPEVIIEFDATVPVEEQTEIESEIRSVIEWDAWPDHVDIIMVRVGDVFCAIACYSQMFQTIDIKYRENDVYAGVFAHEYMHALQAKWQGGSDLYNRWETESIASFVQHKYKNSDVAHACGITSFDPDAPNQYALASFWRTAGASLSSIHQYYKSAQKIGRERALKRYHGYTYDDVSNWLDQQNKFYCSDDQLSASDDIGYTHAEATCEFVKKVILAYTVWSVPITAPQALYQVTVIIKPASGTQRSITYSTLGSFGVIITEETMTVFVELLDENKSTVCSKTLY